MYSDIDVFPFAIGEQLECRSFVSGFEGAWFRAKLDHIFTERNTIRCKLSYCDFTDCPMEDLFQLPRANSRQKTIMLRPAFPRIVDSPAVAAGLEKEPLVIKNRELEPGDFVEWLYKHCHWLCQVVRITGDEAEVHSQGPPWGTCWKTYLVNKALLRPALDWHPESGWRVPQSRHRTPAIPYATIVNGGAIRKARLKCAVVGPFDEWVEDLLLLVRLGPGPDEVEVEVEQQRLKENRSQEQQAKQKFEAKMKGVEQSAGDEQQNKGKQRREQLQKERAERRKLRLRQLEEHQQQKRQPQKQLPESHQQQQQQPRQQRDQQQQLDQQLEQQQQTKQRRIQEKQREQQHQQPRQQLEQQQQQQTKQRRIQEKQQRIEEKRRDKKQKAWVRVLSRKIVSRAHRSVAARQAARHALFYPKRFKQAEHEKQAEKEHKRAVKMMSKMEDLSLRSAFIRNVVVYGLDEAQIRQRATHWDFSSIGTKLYLAPFTTD